MKLLYAIIFSLCLFVTGYNHAQQPGKASQGTPPYYNAENLRSDTFNILKYTIALEVLNGSSPQVTGYTAVRFAPKLNNQAFVRFDLLKLTVDSVKENSTKLTYSHNDTVLRINFAANKGVTDTTELFIYYHGVTQKDPALLGGVFQNSSQGLTYLYNMGTGLETDPVNFGRCWYPCFDNFVERSQFEFIITCDSARKAYCGGQLVSDVVSGSKRTRHWLLKEEIPSYLANFAIAKYAEVKWNVNTLTGNKEILLVSAASDTTAMKNAFVNLKSCITGFENYFGPYKWNRFGYCITPVTSGAMEHATNITYGRALLSIGAEHIMAHELAHHWWGNLITCETPEDMWISEGFASYASDLFIEWQYGKELSMMYIKYDHESIVHYLHSEEGGFRAVSGVPHEYTYGWHVYSKGNDMAHNLRTYMGDSAFFAGCKYVMQQKSYQAINSIELRDLMATGGGKNLNDFFNDWVFNEGWSHFSVDSINYSPASAGGYNAVVHVRQKLFGAPAYHNNVPLELSFFKNDWSRVVRQVYMSGPAQSFTVNVPYAPVYEALNFDSKLSDATSHEYQTIKKTGSHNLALGKLVLNVLNKGNDSSLVRVVHNFVKPDPFKQTTTAKLSDQRYWKVEGIFSPGFHAKAQFHFNGFKGMGGTYGYLDTLLTLVNSDSIALMYRKNTGDDWKQVTAATKVKVNLKSGYVTVDTLKPGEYTFANMSNPIFVGAEETSNDQPLLKLFPNPASDEFVLELPLSPEHPYTLNVYDLHGRLVLQQDLTEQSTRVKAKQLSEGYYTVTVTGFDQEILYHQKLVIE